MDYILNGKAYGSVASVLLQNNCDIQSLRPYCDEGGRQYITQNVNGVLKAVPLVGNATATLRKDEWKHLDDVVVKVARQRLKAVADLRSMGLTYNVPNALGKTVLETETQSDISAASVSMDGLRENANDRPEYELTTLPLPIIHKDFSFSARQIAASRNGGSPLDTTMAEMCARKVAEIAEQLLIGSYGTYAFGGGTIYGYINHPNRATQLLTAPTASAWTPATLTNEVLTMIQSAIDMYHYGPYMLYLGTAWTQYLNQDYSANYPSKTPMQRLKDIDQITDVRTLDYLTGFQVLLVQTTSDVVREVIGFDATTVQWETHGGMKQNFKVMAMMVPQIRADHNDNTGIVHGSSSAGDLT